MTAYKDQLYYKDYSLILFLGAITFGLYYVLAKMILGLSSQALLISVALMLVVMSMWFVIKWIHNNPASIKISSKKIKVKRPIHFLSKKNIEIRKKDIESIQFVTLPMNFKYSGWMVNYNKDCDILDMGDRRGLFISCASGKTCFILSDTLYNDRQDLSAKLMDAGWPIMDEV